ncbi:sigma-70 family RNA polymerase sigma factor [Spirosoma sp. HMF4905]|uniref:Sigma-70 family RNA polymerase sigma factor n=1 Tax=Spirosoma arboris TaxID=2682092 RepID=A0A7K1SG89_9BACT|nr:RNA polymerase sigma factor [Spirosoma arboris]MVM32837.1 sigma-70 family RNA polymerase sigma factor [Spirosoma arboris]
MKRTLLTSSQLQQRLYDKPPVDTFESLYKQYVDKVYRKCLSMTKDEDTAQDYTQDIFLKVFEKFDSFQNRSSFSTWLYSIAYNYCADQLRLAKRLPTTTWEEDGIGHDQSDLPEAQLHEDTLQVVQQAMETLSAKEQNLLRLKYEDGMSIEEIAQLYDIKPSAVKMRLKRSREKVQSLCAQRVLD